jgi:hypothetical protein
MKLLYGTMVLACAPLAFARNDAAYPSEKIAAFVAQRLDVTTLPPELRPKREKGKKTLEEYGYPVRDADDTEILVDAPHGTSKFTLKVLERTSSGIYVCATGQMQDASNTSFQRVLMLKRKDANGLLKSRESGKEFQGCPVIGGVENGPDTSSY